MPAAGIKPTLEVPQNGCQMPVNRESLAAVIVSIREARSAAFRPPRRPRAPRPWVGADRARADGNARTRRRAAGTPCASRTRDSVSKPSFARWPWGVGCASTGPGSPLGGSGQCCSDAWRQLTRRSLCKIVPRPFFAPSRPACQQAMAGFDRPASLGAPGRLAQAAAFHPPVSSMESKGGEGKV